MNHVVNLMTDGARNRADAERLLRVWTIAVGILIVVAALAAAWTWRRRNDVMLLQQALEAKYEPVRMMADENRRLTIAAAQLVRDQRVALELSRERPAATLLQIIGDAVASAEGNVVVERISVTHQPIAANGMEAGGRVVVDVACVEGFDVARLAFALKRPPIRAVKVASSASDSVGEQSVDRHSIECEF